MHIVIKFDTPAAAPPTDDDTKKDDDDADDDDDDEEEVDDGNVDEGRRHRWDLTSSSLADAIQLLLDDIIVVVIGDISPISGSLLECDVL